MVVVTDLTDAKSVAQEMQAIVPDFPSVPVRFIIIKSQEEPGLIVGIPAPLRRLTAVCRSE
jgi:hypothetical protein